jgi:purine-binding chemotaxis protein CheW
MNNLMLIARIAGELIAFDAAIIETVVSIADVTPVPRTVASIVGVAAVRSRVVTVVDPAQRLGFSATKSTGRAVVIENEDHRFALLVDEVLEVCPVDEWDKDIGVSANAQWASVAKGSVDTPYGLALAIDPVKLLPAAAPLARAA